MYLDFINSILCFSLLCFAGALSGFKFIAIDQDATIGAVEITAELGEYAFRLPSYQKKPNVPIYSFTAHILESRPITVWDELNTNQFVVFYLLPEGQHVPVMLLLPESVKENWGRYIQYLTNRGVDLEDAMTKLVIRTIHNGDDYEVDFEFVSEIVEYDYRYNIDDIRETIHEQLDAIGGRVSRYGVGDSFMEHYEFDESYTPVETAPDDFVSESDLIDWGVEPKPAADASPSINECENENV